MTNSNQRDNDYYIYWSSTPTDSLNLNKDSEVSRTPKRAEDYSAVSTNDVDVDVPINPKELELEADLRALYRKYGIDLNKPEQLNKQTQEIRQQLKRFKRDYHDERHRQQQELQVQLLKTGLNKLKRLGQKQSQLSQLSSSALFNQHIWYVLAGLLIFIGAGFIYVSTNQTNQPQPTQQQTQQR